MLFKSKNRPARPSELEQAKRNGIALGRAQTRYYLSETLRSAGWRDDVLSLIDRMPPACRKLPPPPRSQYLPARQWPPQPHPRLAASKLYWILPALTLLVGLLTAAGGAFWVAGGAAAALLLWATVGRGAVTLRGVWNDLQQEWFDELYEESYINAYREARAEARAAALASVPPQTTDPDWTPSSNAPGTT